jgi:hypothetical protein
MTEIETVQEQDEMIHSIEYRNRKQRNAQSQSSLAGACGVLLMLLAGQVSVAQQSAPVKPAAAATDSVRPAPAAANSAAQPAGKKSEAEAPGKSLDGTIKVHGHWVINVRNPDGTLAGHRDFENSLVILDGGDAFLIGLLGGLYVPGDFMIAIAGSACKNGIAGHSSTCGIVRSTATPPGSTLCGPNYLTSICDPSLSSNVVLNPALKGPSITFSGSVAASGAGTITEVTTLFNSCGTANPGIFEEDPPSPPSGPSTMAPTDCTGSSKTAILGILTYTSHFTPVPITAAGQNIEVAVTITFA